MNRRNFNKLLLAAAGTLALPVKAHACGGGCIGSATTYMQISPERNPANIDAMMDRLYPGWQRSKQKCISIKVPPIAENGAVVPVTLQLDKLPATALSCKSLALIGETKISYAQRTLEGKYINIKKQTSCVRFAYLQENQAENPILSMRCKMYSRTTLYVAGEFTSNDGSNQLTCLLFTNKMSVKVHRRCASTVYFEQLQS